MTLSPVLVLATVLVLLVFQAASHARNLRKHNAFTETIIGFTPVDPPPPASSPPNPATLLCPRHVSREELVAAAEAVLSAQPLVTSVDYLSVGCPTTMEELEEVGKAGAIISVAVKLGSVRLIDNVVLPPI